MPMIASHSPARSLRAEGVEANGAEKEPTSSSLLRTVAPPQPEKRERSGTFLCPLQQTVL